MMTARREGSRQCTLADAATMMGPNFYHPYLVVLEYTKAKFPYSVIIELQLLTFTPYCHFLELFIGAAGFYAVGWQKKLNSTRSSWRFRQSPA